MVHIYIPVRKPRKITYGIKPSIPVIIWERTINSACIIINQITFGFKRGINYYFNAPFWKKHVIIKL